MNESDKPITITRDTKTADHSILEDLSIWDMLYAVELENPLFDVFLKQGTKLNLKNDAAGKDFIFSKHEELKACVNANNKDAITLEDVKALISGWIEEQARIADQMHQVEESETQTFDQNDVKKLGLAYQILQAEKEIETQSEEDLKTRIAQGYPVEAEDLKNKAEQHASQGKYAEAEPLYKQALEILEKSLGPDHYEVEIYLNDMAEFYKVQGRYEEAEPIYLRAIAINAKNLGPDNISIVTNLDALAFLYKKQGRYAEAESIYMRALAINEKLDPDHPEVAISLGYLAGLYREQGRYTEVEPLLMRALSIMEKSLGSEHPNTKIARKNLKILQEESAKKAKSDEINLKHPVSGASGVNQ